MSEHSSGKKRIVALALLFFFLFSMLFARYYTLQIIEEEKWAKIADRQHYFLVKLPAKRGTFYSNPLHFKSSKKVPFAVDIERFDLNIDPLSIPQKSRGELLSALKELLNLNQEECASFRLQLEKKSRSRTLSEGLEREVKGQIEEFWDPFRKKHKIAKNALYFSSIYRRCYPYGSLLGQLLHTVQEKCDPKTLRAIPTGGLEMHFDKYLRGKTGLKRLLRSPRNSLEVQEVIEAPKSGADVYLTVNHVLQQICEEEIEAAVKRSNAKAGWVVMIDPYTGEILALAEYPPFFPENYKSYFNSKNDIECTRLKTATDANEPGSVMKPLNAAIAMAANEELKAKRRPPIFNPDEKADTSNSTFIGRSKPLKDVSFHKFLNMDMAVQKSSNIYFSRVIEKVIAEFGSEWYRGKLEDFFGFGKKTGVELPSESCGFLPRIGKKYKNGALEWSTGTPVVLAIGYNLQTTPLQLARAYAVLANGGRLVDLTLVKKIAKENEEGGPIFDNTGPKRLQQFPQVLSPAIVKRVVTAMKYVTKPGGSSARADVKGYSVVGKSSTSEKLVGGSYRKDLNRAGFTGFAPADNPAFVISLTLDEPEAKYIPGIGRNQFGGASAAPVFKEIACRSLEYLGIPPDDPGSLPKDHPLYLPVAPCWKAKTEELQEIYKKWNSS